MKVRAISLNSSYRGVALSILALMASEKPSLVTALGVEGRKHVDCVASW